MFQYSPGCGSGGDSVTRCHSHIRPVCLHCSDSDLSKAGSDTHTSSATPVRQISCGENLNQFLIT